MNESSSNQDDPYSQALALWLPELNMLTKIIDTIGQALADLSEKRVTLEEKMIRAHLHQVSAQCADIIREAHLVLSSHSDAIALPALDGLPEMTSEILAVVSDLLKTVRYNLNYLEQYYEYDFNLRLENEYHFVERLKVVGESMRLARTRQ